VVNAKEENKQTKQGRRDARGGGGGLNV